MPAPDSEAIWRAKVAAWLHDPPEKALILMRRAGGHEAGTVRALRDQLFGPAGLPPDVEDTVRRADRAAVARRERDPSATISGESSVSL